MTKRPTTTLLAITGQFVARADFGPAPERPLVGFWQSAAPRDAALHTGVRTALALGPRCAGEVWLLTDQLWTQRVYFASPVMADLNGEQLQRAIGFEVESFSGIPGLNSRVGIHRLGVTQGSEAFWVTQIQDVQVAEITAAVAAAGGRLCGIVHPGGLPVPLASKDKTATFSRVEIWGRATLCVERIADEPAQVRVINVGPAQPQWHESVDTWLARVTAPDTEWLHATEPNQPTDESVRSASFHAAGTHTMQDLPPLAGEALREFLGLWVRELSTPAPRVPVVVPPPVPVRVSRLLAISAALLALTLVSCTAHDLWLRGELNEARSRLADIDRSQQQAAQLKTQSELIQKQLQQMSAGAPSPSGIAGKTDEIRRQQERWPALFAAIAESTSEAVVVERLTGEPGGDVCLDGSCLRPAAADDLAARMSLALTAKGWTVGAAEKSASSEVSAEPLWQYRILVSPPGAASAPAAAKGGAPAPHSVAGGL